LILFPSLKGAPGPRYLTEASGQGGNDETSMAIISDWVTRYGYLGIFSLLVAGIVGLPVPDETILAFAGFLVYRGILHLAPTIAAALMGTLCGITVSYTLGRTAGLGLLRRYGRYLHLTQARIDRVHQWFERVGRWTLLIGYFIPGVRHLTALVAGASRLRFRAFALFAYTGGLIWSLTFISVGFFFGQHWKSVLDRIQTHVDDVIMIALGLLLVYLLARRLRRARI
jgi:membrane protein DedA with SNARE-associated domain